jgi:hypothetical protein
MWELVSNLVSSNMISLFHKLLPGCLFLLAPGLTSRKLMRSLPKVPWTPSILLSPCFCLLLNIACIHTVCTQSYLNYTSTWTESSASCGFSGTCDYLDYTRTLTGDTVINGKTYYKVFTSGTLSTYDLNLEQIVSVVPFTSPMKYMREEQKRFLFYHPSLNDDIIFADFDLTVGDTAVNIYCQSPLIVDHIDTVYLNAEPRRRFYFGPGSPSWANKTLIEGVGSSAGLFTNPCHEIGIESGSSMTCFSQDDGLIVLDTSSACNPTVSIELPSTSHPSVHVFPNPAGDYVDVVVPTQARRGPLRITLYNLQGELLSTQSIKEQEGRLQIDLSSLAPAIYFLFVYSGKEFEVIKVLKVR